MMNNINIEKLKQDLIDYFGTAMFSVSPLSIFELSKIEKATDEEIIEIALKNNFDLNNYKNISKKLYL